MKITWKIRLMWKILWGRPVMYRFKITRKRIEPKGKGAAIYECDFKNPSTTIYIP